MPVLLPIYLDYDRSALWRDSQLLPQPERKDERNSAREFLLDPVWN